MPISFSLRLGQREFSFQMGARTITAPKDEQAAKRKHPLAIDHPPEYTGPQLYAVNGYLTSQKPRKPTWSESWDRFVYRLAVGNE